MTSYGVWLSWNNQEESFQLPINPTQIEVSDGGKGSTYDIEKLGEINVILNPKLTMYSFDGLFPAQEYPFLDAPLFPPVTVDGVKQNYYVHYLNKWMANKRPIRFVFVGDGYEINTAASIESFTWQDVAGSGGDITYSLTLKKYIFYSAQRVNVGQTSTGERIITKDKGVRSSDKQPPKTYTMVAGDTLWKVAQKQLGNGNRWKEIQTLNGITDAEIKRLQVGRVLKLP